MIQSELKSKYPVHSSNIEQHNCKKRAIKVKTKIHFFMEKPVNKGVNNILNFFKINGWFIYRKHFLFSYS